MTGRDAPKDALIKESRKLQQGKSQLVLVRAGEDVLQDGVVLADILLHLRHLGEGECVVVVLVVLLEGLERIGEEHVVRHEPGEDSASGNVRTAHGKQACTQEK